MRDVLLNELRNKFEDMNSVYMVESLGVPRSDSQLLSESKRQFPHLNESQILENRRILDNINYFKLTVKEIQSAFSGMKFAEARAFQRAVSQFAILEYYSRCDIDDNKYVNQVNESSKLILELEFDPEKSISKSDLNKIDPNDPDAKKYRDYMAAYKSSKGMTGGPEDTVGPKIDVSSGKSAPTPEKKKGFIKSVKEFILKAGEYVKEILTNKKTYKALAIGAVMVILGVIAAAVGGWAAIGFGALKAVLGGISIFKGAKELINTKDFAQGKKGLEGVKQWIKSAKQPANAAKVIIGVAQVALGAWGASSAVGQAMVEIKTMAAEQTFNAAGAPEMARTGYTAADMKDVMRAAGAESPASDTAAPVAATTSPIDSLRKIGKLVGDNYEQYLNDPDKINQKILNNLESKYGISPDAPAAEAFKELKVTGNVTVRDYIEMKFEGIAKAKQLAAMSGR